MLRVAGFCGAAMLLIANISFAASKAPQPATGLFHRAYFLAAAGKSIPYEIYVPSSYDGSKSYPLAVYLHGATGDETELFSQTYAINIAERKNIIVLAPLGYNPFGAYGDIYPVMATVDAAERGLGTIRDLSRTSEPDWAKHNRHARVTDIGVPARSDADYVALPAADLADPKTSRLSEQDTMNVIALVRKGYRIDPDRIYLFGNSMGGVGTLYLAAKYASMWAAIAPAGGPIAAWSYPFERLRQFHIAVLYVHGSRDEHSHYRWSQALADASVAAGVDASLYVVQGGTHMNAWVTALPRIFDFFLKHRKSAPHSELERGKAKDTVRK